MESSDFSCVLRRYWKGSGEKEGGKDRRVRPEKREMKESEWGMQVEGGIIRVRQLLAAWRKTSMLSGSEGFSNVRRSQWHYTVIRLRERASTLLPPSWWLFHSPLTFPLVCPLTPSCSLIFHQPSLCCLRSLLLFHPIFFPILIDLRMKSICQQLLLSSEPPPLQ